MSMNLIWKVKGIKRSIYVDFPYQTTTKLTYKVLEAKTTAEQYKLIKENIASFVDVETDTHWAEILDDINRDLNSDDLELSIT